MAMLRAAHCFEYLIKRPNIITFILSLWLTLCFGLIGHFMSRGSFTGCTIVFLLFTAVLVCIYLLFRKVALETTTYITNGASEAAVNEKPPTYDDVMKDDPPPPAYYELFTEIPTEISVRITTPAPPSTTVPRHSPPEYDDIMRTKPSPLRSWKSMECISRRSLVEAECLRRQSIQLVVEGKFLLKGHSDDGLSW